MRKNMSKHDIHSYKIDILEEELLKKL
jgi:hypothetical protein